MKILFAIKALDDAHGGAERVLADIASGLANKGHEVSILSFDQPGGESFYPLAKPIKRICVGIGDVKAPVTLLNFFKKIIAIRKIVKKTEPDCVVGFMHSTFVLAAFGMIGTSIPLIASEHIVPEHYKTRRKEYFLFLISRFFIDKITVLSQKIIESYPPVLRSKMYAITNPVYLVVEMADTVGSSTEDKIILNVGRLEAQKDQETLIKAFALVVGNFPDWKLKIVGEGTLRPKLEKLAATLGLEEQIMLPGTTSKIDAEYSSAHIFAMTSTYESFGLVTAEAMAHGLPTLGYASCPGTNELIVHEQNGLLVDGDDRIQVFAEGLKKLMNDHALREKLGKQGIKTAQQFSSEAIVKQWEKLLESVIHYPLQPTYEKTCRLNQLIRDDDD